MKSIKPGRGPSFMGGIMSIFVGLFGIVWTVIAINMGGGIIFALFGVIFVAIAVVQTVYHFKNAAGKNRYSAFDITDGSEEPDPLNMRFGGTGNEAWRAEKGQRRFCPYCGAPAGEDFAFCDHCGKKLP